MWIRGAAVTPGYCELCGSSFQSNVTQGGLNPDKMPELTAETITKDGWLQTGGRSPFWLNALRSMLTTLTPRADIGQWNEEDGTLSVIDRKKILIKLSGGEVSNVQRTARAVPTYSRALQYVALERLEYVFNSQRPSLVPKVQAYKIARSVYSSCRFVARICVHADSNATKPMAVRSPAVFTSAEC